MRQTEFLGGSPVTDPTNPLGGKAVGTQPDGDQDILGSLPVAECGANALNTLDGYGSAPVTSDQAAARPPKPPTIGSSKR